MYAHARADTHTTVNLRHLMSSCMGSCLSLGLRPLCGEGDLLHGQQLIFHIVNNTLKAGWYTSHLCPHQLLYCSRFLLERAQVSALLSLLTLRQKILILEVTRYIKGHVSSEERETAGKPSHTGSSFPLPRPRRQEHGGLTSAFNIKPTIQDLFITRPKSISR